MAQPASARPSRTVTADRGVWRPMPREPVRVMAWVAFAAPRGRMRGAATTAMRVISEERQRHRRPRAAANPPGTWGLRPHASLLVVNDATSIGSSSRLAWDSQAPCARPMPLPGHAPGSVRGERRLAGPGIPEKVGHLDDDHGLPGSQVHEPDAAALGSGIRDAVDLRHLPQASATQRL